MVLHGCPLLGDTLFLGLYLLFGHIEFLFVVDSLGDIAAVRREVTALEHEHVLTQHSPLEIYNPFGVESVAAIAGFEVQMRAAAASGRSAKAQKITCMHPLAGHYIHT